MTTFEKEPAMREGLQLVHEQLDALDLVGVRADALLRRVKHHRVRMVQAAIVATLVFAAVNYAFAPAHTLLGLIVGEVAIIAILFFADRHWKTELIAKPQKALNSLIYAFWALILWTSLGNLFLKEGSVWQFFAGTGVVLALQCVLLIREVKAK